MEKIKKGRDIFLHPCFFRWRRRRESNPPPRTLPIRSNLRPDEEGIETMLCC